jgi:hypothetical protein
VTGAPAPREVAALLCSLGHDAAAGVVAEMAEELALVPLRLAQVALAYAGPAEDDHTDELEVAA